MSYIPPSIRTVREDLQSTVVITGAEVIPLLIGTTNGRTVSTLAFEQTLGATVTHVFTVSPPVEDIVSIRSQSVGGITYVEGTDFTFVQATQTLTWLATTLAAPFLISLAASTSGGSIAAGNHFYVVTATRVTDNSPLSTGETLQSNTLLVATTGVTSSVLLTWNPVIGAEGYKIFRRDGGVLADPFITPALVATVVGGFTNTFTDTAAAPGVGAPPGANTAFKRPAFDGGKFFVDYTVTATAHFTIKRFTDLAELINEHGLGSNLALAGTVCMGTSGRGNAASIALTMSIPDDNLATYQTAFDFAKRRRDVDLVVPTATAQNVATSLKAHVEEVSAVDKQRERQGIVGTPVGTQIGSVSESGTAVARAAALDSERMQLVYPWPILDVQQADGTFLEEEKDGWVLAAALAGRIASLPDRAEPATTKEIFGITSLGTPNGQPFDETEMNILGAAQVTVIADEDGKLIVRDHLTTKVDEFLQHPNIILTDDFLRRTLRTQFKNFRGRKLLGNLLIQIEKKTKRVLQALFKLGLITFFDPLSVSTTQDPDRPTFVIVRFSYRPVFPLRVIEFRYSFDLRTSLLAAA